MALVDPTMGRAIITDDGTSLTITIPTKKSVVHIFVLCVWFMVWLLSESSLFSQVWNNDISGSPAIPILFFWAVWTVAGVFVFAVLLWKLFGSEVITCTVGRIYIEKTIRDLGTTKEYETQIIYRLRVIPTTVMSFWGGHSRRDNFGEVWGISGGQIAFDYGVKTVRFGIGLDEAEARHLVEQLHDRGYIRREED